MQEPTLWGSNQVANSDTAGEQHSVSVAALQGGGYVVVWQSGAPSSIQAQIYGADGMTVGDQMQVSDPLNGAWQQAPRVVGLDTGGFAVSWFGVTDTSGSDEIHAAVFGADGSTVKADFVANTELGLINKSQSVHAIHAVPGGFYISYVSAEGQQPAEHDVLLMQGFANDGTPSGAQALIAEAYDLDFNSLEMGSLGGGNFGIVWGIGDIGEQDVYLAKFRPSGSQAGSNTPLTTAVGNQTRAVVASDGNGKFLIVFDDTSNSPNDPDNINGQFLDAEGNPIAADGTVVPDSRFAVSDPTLHGGGGSTPAMIALHTGGYFVAWDEYWGGNGAIVGQLFDTNGVKIGSEMVIKGQTTPPSSVHRVKLAELADGRIIVTWADDTHDGADQDGYGIHAQIIDPRAGTILGTEYGEALLGSEPGALSADTITALGGNDTIDGLDGADIMDGGMGDDTYYVDDSDDAIVEAVGQGYDTVYTAVSYTLDAGQEVEKLVGLFPLLEEGPGYDLTGNELDNWLISDGGSSILKGMGGNDTLDGGSFSDTMIGGDGDDTYVLRNVFDQVVVEGAKGGIDTVQTSNNYTLLENFENLAFGSAGYTLIGTGNAANNRLTGSGNADVLNGLDGNDTLDGDYGADTMSGGEGNDVYYVDNLADVLTETGNGIDTVRSRIGFILGAGFENLVFEETALSAVGKGNGADNSLTGNSFKNKLQGVGGNDKLYGRGDDDTLSGGSGNDTLDGGDGSDRLEGGSGDDTYVLGAGTDMVVDSSGADDRIITTISRSLGAYSGIENLTLAGTGNINGRGSAVANDLIGNAGNNQLRGLDGNDMLRGGAGADQLWGGKHADIFDFNSAAEIGKSAGNRDIIKDFKHLTDRIDLKSIDASTKAAGNNAFKFAATEGSKFTGIAGQLIWDQINKLGTANDVTLVRGDLNGDKVADFVLELTGLVSLSQSDFIL